MAEINKQEIVRGGSSIDQVNELVKGMVIYLKEKIPKGAINRIRANGTYHDLDEQNKFVNVSDQYILNSKSVFSKKYADGSWYQKGTKQFDEYQQHRVMMANLLATQFKAVSCTEFCILAYDHLAKQNLNTAFSRVYLHNPLAKADIFHEVILFNPNNESLEAFSQKNYAKCSPNLIIFDPWNDYKTVKVQDFDTYLKKLKQEQRKGIFKTIPIENPQSYGIEIIQSYVPSASLQSQQSSGATVQLERDKKSLNVMIQQKTPGEKEQSHREETGENLVESFTEEDEKGISGLKQ